MLNLKKTAVAGTLESSDAMVTVEPSDDISINIESEVLELYGESIEKTVYEILEKFEVCGALVNVIDKGALDCTIRARLACAICRAAEISYDWHKEDIFEKGEK